MGRSLTDLFDFCAYLIRFFRIPFGQASGGKDNVDVPIPYRPFRPYLPRCHILATCSPELTSNRTRFERSVTAVVTSLPAGEGDNGGHDQRTGPGRPIQIPLGCGGWPAPGAHGASQAWLFRLFLASGPDWRKDSNSSVSTPSKKLNPGDWEWTLDRPRTSYCCTRRTFHPSCDIPRPTEWLPLLWSIICFPVSLLIIWMGSRGGVVPDLRGCCQ